MNVYQIYAKAADRLCDQKPGIADADRFNARLHRLYNKVRKSQLTVYQKEYLLQQLDQARTPTTNGTAAGKTQRRAKHHDSALLAA